MRYPTIGIEHVQRLQPQLAAGEGIDIQASIRWVGSGDDDMDLRPIERVAFEIRTSWEVLREDRSAGKLDAFEATAGVELHRVLSELPLAQLDDPGFWRYLTVAHFWWLVEWRESRAFKSGDWSKIKAYVDGTRPAECVVLRMFIRAGIALEGGSYDLASAVPQATDLWRSHIVRVKTGYNPVLTAALLESQVDDRMSTETLRIFARRLNRVNSNVVTAAYDSDDAQRLISELRDRL